MEDSWVYWKGVKLAARFVLGVIINQLIVVKFYNKENTRLGFCAFTVTPLKIKMRTSRCRKPRIREMKEDEYSKSFAKHQVCTIIYRLCMKTPCWCLFELLWGAQIWPPQTNRNICFWVLLMRELPGAGGGGSILPYKGLMGTCGHPGYVFRDFCLKQVLDFIIFCLNQGIDFINFCLKQDIFSGTINSLRVCPTN